MSVQSHNLPPRPPGSYGSYTAGFVLSIILTLLAYLAVSWQWFSRHGILSFIICLALVQLVVQVLFFLHLARESRPRWNLMAFLFMLMVVLILGLGSIWIMNHLNYHAMSTHDTTQYIQNEEGIHQ